MFRSAPLNCIELYIKYLEHFSSSSEALMWERLKFRVNFRLVSIRSTEKLFRLGEPNWTCAKVKKIVKLTDWLSVTWNDEFVLGSAQAEAVADPNPNMPRTPMPCLAVAAAHQSLPRTRTESLMSGPAQSERGTRIVHGYRAIHVYEISVSLLPKGKETVRVWACGSRFPFPPPSRPHVLAARALLCAPSRPAAD